MPVCCQHYAFCVSLSLVHEMKQNGWIVCKVALAHTWPLWVQQLPLFVLFFACDPTLACCCHGCFRVTSLSNAIPLTPPARQEALYGNLATVLGESVVGWSVRGLVFYSQAIHRVHPKFGSAESTSSYLFLMHTLTFSFCWWPINTRWSLLTWWIYCFSIIL